MQLILKSTSVKKTTFRTPFLGGSAILEIFFLTLSLHKVTQIILRLRDSLAESFVS